MKGSLAIFSIPMVLLLSCNNAPKEESKSADTTSPATAPPPAAEAKPAFNPFKVVIIQHKVKNFNKAVAGYFSRDSLLKSYGLVHVLLARDMKDTNQIFAIDRIENVDSTRAFFKNPKVLDIMAKAGVGRAPGYSYATIVRESDAPKQNDEVMSIAHHVKNYDSWLKAFDAESDQRKANGLIDRALARDEFDPNMVYITFEVSDDAKARARMASPELKKMMADAGVDSPPTVRWYRVIK